ncbi:hypothetical protein ACVWWN_007773 [Mycobacterium sp. URHB0021]
MRHHPKTVKRIVEKFATDQARAPPPEVVERAHNYDRVAELVAERIAKSQGVGSLRNDCRQSLRLRAIGVLTVTSAAWTLKRKCCGAGKIIADVILRCGHRVSIW